MNDDYLHGVEECAEYVVKEIEKVMGNHIVLDLGPPKGGKSEAVLTIPDLVAFYKALTKLECRLENVIDALRDQRSEQFLEFVDSLQASKEKQELKCAAEETKPTASGL